MFLARRRSLVVATAGGDCVCATKKICSRYKYESWPPTATSDRVYSLYHACSGSEYTIPSAMGPAPLSKAVLQTLTLEQASDQYLSLGGQCSCPDQCTPLATCGPNEWAVTEATETSDRLCRRLKVTACDMDTEYQVRKATKHSHEVCAELDVCDADAFEAVAPTAVSNRICKVTVPSQRRRWACVPGFKLVTTNLIANRSL